MILASQNLPKTLPKSFQNRGPKKHAIFHRFLFEKCFVAKAPTSISYWFFQYFLLVGHFSSNRFSHAFWVQKTYQKPSKIEVPTLQKSMSKTCCFPTSIFSRFWFHFGEDFGSKIDQKSKKIEKNGNKILSRILDAFLEFRPVASAE